MSRPKVYIHRLGGDWYGRYMDAANEAALAAFADIIVDDRLPEIVSTADHVARMAGSDAILSLGGGYSDRITGKVLSEVGTIKAICIAHWCGQMVTAAQEAAIPVVEGSNANTVAVAEWTVTAALMGVRRLHSYDRRLKTGSPWAEPRHDSGMLRGTRVGLVGLGRIGCYVAKWFRMMGMEVLAFDAMTTPAQAAELGIRLANFDEVLACPVVSLHLPVTPQTTGMIGARELAKMPDGCVFINSARAALCDESALTTALRNGRISAVLDVFAVEPLPLDHPFRTLDNVVITPHLAGDNLAMFRACGADAVETLRKYFAGEGLVDRRFAFP